MANPYGLYVCENSNGRIKNTLIDKNGKILIEERKVADEIILFEYTDFQYYAEVVDALFEMAQKLIPNTTNKTMKSVRLKEDDFRALVQTALSLVETLEKEDLVFGTLTRTLLEDNVPPDDVITTYLINTARLFLKV